MFPRSGRFYRLIMAGNVFWRVDEFTTTTTARTSQSKRGSNWLRSWCTCVHEQECVCECILCPAWGSECAWMLFQQGCRSSVGDEYADMTVMHGDVYSKPRDKSSGDEWGKKSWSERSWCLYRTLLNTGFTLFSEDTSYITLSLQWGSCCLLCMISPKECSYYLSWQCWACTVGSCSALVRTADV